MRKKYIQLSVINLVLGVCAIFLYLPYTLEAFDMPGFEWFSFVQDIFKNNYYDVLVYFGIFLLLWFILSNVISILSHVNLPKLLFKLSIILSLILPLIYVTALKNNGAMDFWIKNISQDIKMVSYVLLCICWGTWGLALLFNFTRNSHANLHHILDSLVMCVLLTLMIICKNWCGWNIVRTYKLYGIMVGLYAMYLPISAITIFACRKKRV